MIGTVPQTLKEIAISLNILVRAQPDFPLDLYAEVKAEKLLEVITQLKEKYNVTHLSTIIGQDQDDGYHLLYPFSITLSNNKWGKLILDVTVDKKDPRIDSLVPEIPGAILYEREVYDMLGIQFTNHPNLRRLLTADFMPEDIFPLRKDISYEEIFERLAESLKKKEVGGVASLGETEAAGRHIDYASARRRGPMGAYIDYVPERSDFAIAIGPQHPALEEPVRFIFHVTGETVKKVDVRLGFNHRGIEKAFESRTWLQNLYLAERICGICSNCHQLCYCQAAEKCANLSDKVPDRAKYIRVIIAELERIHSHLLWIGLLAHEAGFDTLFHFTWQDRELVMDILELISGNRVNYSMDTLGGVRRDITPEQIVKIIPKLKELRKRGKHHREELLHERSFLARQKGIAILSKEDALRYCTVGPTARASGIKRDIRKADPYAAYDQFSFDVPVLTEGDVFSGLEVRLDEVSISIDLIIEALETLPQGELQIRFPRKIPEDQGISRVEGPRGENMHYVRSIGTDKPERHKVRTPTLANIPSLVHRLTGVNVADLPPVIRVIDPCVGCMDRVTFVDLKKGKKVELLGEQLISRANRAYRSGIKVLNF